MKKALIVATVVKKHIMQFHLPTLEMLKDNGWETHVAGGNDYINPSDCRIPHCDVYHEIDFARFPFHVKNIKAYRELKKIIDKGGYDLIHCHTPVGGVLTRLAARGARKKGTKVFYTAHGFHFFKGAPLLNWLIYYPVEWLCSYMTDCIITVNEEDYRRAKKRFRAKNTEKINGVGVNVEASKNTDAENTGKDMGITEDDIVLLSVGEVRKLKNHKTIIKAMAMLLEKRIHYIIAGEGNLEKELVKLAESLGVSDRVHLLGYRNDISALIGMSDIFCFPSYREGLSVAVMEAMAGGLPVLASRIRGNTDLIDEGMGGFLYRPDDVDGFAEGIEKLCADRQCAREMTQYNLKKIKMYDVVAVCAQLRKIYNENGVEL